MIASIAMELASLVLALEATSPPSFRRLMVNGYGVFISSYSVHHVYGTVSSLVKPLLAIKSTSPSLKEASPSTTLLSAEA